ncbi:MAG: methionine--tRNA ligase subunit beta [Phycisphaerales bacterium]|nr:methionine--tRNA ligase subunit beta [Phycisphaerales bacterium]
MAETPTGITIDDFVKIELRVARVLSAALHPNADKLLVLQIDLGDEQRQLCAGIRGHYAPEDLVGKNIVVVANLAPRTMRGEVSQGMLLAASTPDRSSVVVLTTDRDVPPGSTVS